MATTSIKFPAIVAFHLQREKSTGNQSIMVTVEKGKKEPSKRNFGELKRYSYTGDMAYAILSVERVDDEESLLKRTNELHKLWIPETTKEDK